MARSLRLLLYDYEDDGDSLETFCAHEPAGVPISPNSPLFQQQSDNDLDGEREAEFLRTVVRGIRRFRMLNGRYVSKEIQILRCP